jgi:hypothetical protein
MKKFNNRTQAANNTTNSVSVAIDETKLLCDMVEELAKFKRKAAFNPAASPEGWTTVESSTLEAYISGTVSMDLDGGHVKPSFVASFVFTCVRPINGDYALCFMNSMS